ncbi:MAG: YDG domain-containing protein [Rhodoferax sp.]|nr:YDG domain-containing protein [Rhodoferax sp.]
MTLALASAFASPASLAQALPTGGVAIHGQASFSNPAPNQLRVATLNGIGSNHSAINWQSFSIAPGSSTNFQQPSASSTSINRVVTNTPSAIFGHLSSNGKLVLVNQSGIAVGAGAVVDTAGFIASALRMSDADASAGRLRFGAAGSNMDGAAGITVAGRITARDGDVVLLAPNIDTARSALVQAPNGSTVLAAGQQVEITGRGLEGITLQVQAPANQVRNLGTLQGDAVGIFAGTLRHSGEIQALQANLEGGRVVLRASGDALVEGAGRIVASGTLGGRVDVLGNRVAIADQAEVDASGANGGGSIRIGGDYQGRNTQVPNAQMTYVGADTLLNANATASGSGGRVIVWADDVTRAYGTIAANAASASGGGGFVETSGHRYLDVNGIRVTASGSAAQPGTWLLDPSDITITHAAAPGALGNATQNTIVLGPGSLTFFRPVDGAATSTLTDANLNQFINAGSNLNVVVTTTNPSISGAGSGDITFDGLSNGPIVIQRTNNANTNSNSLTLNADRNIVFASGTTTFERSGAAAGTNFTVELNPGTTVAGRVTTSAGATVVLNGVNDQLDVIVQNGRVWENSGTVTMNGKSIIRLPNQSGYATFANLNGGTLNVNSSNQWSFLSDSNPQGGILNNAGTINVNGTFGGVNTSWEARYSNLPGGTLNLGVGKSLSMQNANTLAGAVFIDAGGVLTLSQQFGGARNFSNTTFGGTGTLAIASGVSASFANTSGSIEQLTVGGGVTVNGAVSIEDYVQTAGGSSLGGSGTVGITRSFNHTAGTFAPSGNVSINQASGNFAFNDALSVASLALAAPTGTLTLNGATVTSGALSLTASGAIGQGGAAPITAGGATSVNAGTSAVTLTHASNNFNSLGVTGGMVQLRDSNALVLNAVNAQTSLVVNTGGSLTQSAAAVVAGATTINAASNPVTLNAGNDFNSIGVTGTLVNITDVNAVSLAVTSANSLTVNAGGAVTQSAALVISGTTSVNAAGNVTLATAGNNLNQLNVSGQAINVVEGAGSSLTVLSLASGANQPVALAAGHTLTLPGTTINAGSADITLFSGIGPLVIPALLVGHNMTLTAATDLTINSGGINASGNVSLTAADTITLSAGVFANSGLLSIANTNAAAVMRARSFASAASINVNLAGGLTVQGTGSGAGLLAQSAGQTVNAKYVEVLTSLAAGNSEISSFGGANQSITTTGVNGAGEGLLVRNADSAAGIATITSSGAGAQTITVNNADAARVRGNGGLASIVSGGNQTIVLQGASSTNNLQLGIGAGTGDSDIRGNNQQITAGQTGQLGGIQMLAGALDGVRAGIFNASGTQTVKTTGLLALLGGSGSGAAGGDCRSGLGTCAFIDQGGAALQTVSAGNYTLNGGSSGSRNVALIGSSNAGSSQRVEVRGGGNLNLFGGSGSGSFNEATVLSPGNAQTIDFIAGGALNLAGGTVGTRHTAGIFANAAGSVQTISGSPTITLAGGLNGGGFSLGNRAIISTNGSQNFTVGAGGLHLTGGGGTGLQTDNDAQIFQGGGAGTSQAITVTGGGAIVMQGGSSALQNVGGATHGSRALIEGDGDSQTITFASGGSIDLTGGTNGSRAFAQIFAGNNATQSIFGSPTIDLTGGASGGIVGEGNGAYIATNSGSQTITASAITLTGGSGGTENLANIQQSNASGATTGTQTITVTAGGAVDLQGGVGVTNLARIRNFGAIQTLNFASGGSLNLTGGTGASLNFARVEAVNGTQTISGAPTINLTGGASGGANLNGNFADIHAIVGSQTISASSTALQAGAAGINNFAVITAPVQNISIIGDLDITGGGSSPSLDGTQGGGARIGGAGSGATNLALNVIGDLTLTGGTVSGVALGTNVVGGAPTTITATVGGNLVINPGSSPSAGVRIGSTTANLAGGNITLNVPNGTFALNGAVAGETAIRTAGDIAVNANTIFINNRVSGANVLLDSVLGVNLGGIAAITATAASGDSLKVDAGSASFINTAGAGALNTAAGARWLVFSADPANDTRGGLVYDFKQYGKTFGDATPILGAGDGFLYSLSPSLTASLVGVVNKRYDGTTAATLGASNYSVSGLVGDVITLNRPVVGSYDSRNVGVGKLVTVNGLAVANVRDGSASVFGYGLLVSSLTGAVGRVTGASLTLSTNAVTKDYDGNTSALGAAVVTGGALAAGDSLVGGSFAFANRNAGTNKTVTVSGITVNDGNGGANYSVNLVNNTSSTINQLASVSWTGSAGDGLWSSANNWAGGAIPDRANVAAVVIPAGAGTVSLDPLVGTVSIQSLSSARPVMQTGSALVTSQLTLDTLAGIFLVSAGNRIAGLRASNAGSGDIVVQSSGPMLLGTVINTAGSIDVAAVLPGGSMLVSGPVAARNLLSLYADTNLAQTGAVLGFNGVTVASANIFQPYGQQATANGAVISYLSGGVAIAPPPKQVLTELRSEMQSFDGQFRRNLRERLSQDDFNPNGSRRRRGAADGVVAEGEICR